MGQQELFTLAVAIAGVMIVGRAVANRLEIPDAIVLVVLGVLAGLIPQVPNIDLPPDVVLVLFLPPLVYNAAFLSAPRESRENAVPITGLAFGATAATIAAVGRGDPAGPARHRVGARAGLRRRRGPHRRRGRHLGADQAGRAAAGGHHPGGREPDQRRGRAHRVRPGRGGDGQAVHVRPWRDAAGRGRPRRDRLRAGRRGGDRAGPQAGQGPGQPDPDLADHPVRGLHPGR